jgi:predicted ATPase/DNA-binding SARP family transcriptional activator
VLASVATSSSIEFGVLGPLEIACGDRVVLVPAPRQRALLAVLLLHANETVSSERLIEELWGEEPPPTAASALRVHIAQLRQTLAGVTRVDQLLVTRPPGYALLLDPDQLDLHRFTRLVEEGSRALSDGRRTDAAQTLRDALGLWRGPPLADLAYEPFAQAEAARLEELRLAAIEKRVEADLALGRHADLVAELESLVAEHPLRESFRRQLMLALYRSGRQAEALAAYQDARRTLVDELGIEPGPELQRIERAILRQDPDLERRGGAAAGGPATLPTELTTFVGRERELDELRTTLTRSDVRLLTLTGAGGSGKTRLAVRAAREVTEDFADGVVFVGLTALADGSLVVRAVAQTLGVPESASRPLVESVITHLAAKEMLLVLDNFEHVLPAALEVAGVLSACPKVRVLATSRVPLHVQGEHEFEVQPLDVPPEEAALHELVASPAVQLFAERAQAIRHDFAVDDENGPAVGEVCARLDGLPLAIELAAARTRVLSPAAMLARLQDRLALGAARGRPSRHRTLRTSIAWSHDLLGERERTLFRRLAVFRGGCTLAAAEAIDVSPLDTFATLTSLVQHNLVKTRWTVGGEARFEMLETIAEFAREQLAESGELDDVRRRHAQYYVELAEAIEPHLYDDGRAPWMLVLADERDNIRAALGWSVENDEARLGLRILAALWLMYWTQFNEGLEWAERLLPLPSAAAPSPERAGALFTAQLCAAGGGDLVLSGQRGEEAVAVAREIGDDKWLAFALVMLVAVADRDPSRVLARSDEALDVASRTGNPWIYAWMNLIGGLAANLVGEFEDARRRASDAVAGFTELGDSWSRASASMSLGIALIVLGDPEAARAALDGSVPALLEVGDLKMASGCTLALAMSERFMGNVGEAEAQYRHALELCRQAGDPSNACVCLEGLAACLALVDPRRAARLLGAARALVDRGLQPAIPFSEPLYEHTLDTLQTLERGDLERLMEEGRQDATRGDFLKPDYVGTAASV